MTTLTEMIVRAEIGLPPGPTGIPATIAWMNSVLSQFSTTAVCSPIAAYCQTPGSRGIIGTAITASGSLTVRVFDEVFPAIAQINFQSDADITVDVVTQIASNFSPNKLDYIYINRTSGLTMLTEGGMGSASATPTGELPPRVGSVNASILTANTTASANLTTTASSANTTLVSNTITAVANTVTKTSTKPFP